jgi:imidazole glycerol-phosphate synthase subunit HisH
MITIINYGVGNLKSIRNILKKVGADAIISSSKEDINAATKLILPGVGHFDHCMKAFNASGLRDLVEKRVLEEKLPVLGICAGCQMLMQESEEGSTPGLGWLTGNAVRFDASKIPDGAKIPHMGWANVSPVKNAPLYADITDPRFYFVHSFHIVTGDPGIITATARYGYEFVASVGRDNIQGVQFHPEKSHRFGMQLYKNFSQV